MNSAAGQARSLPYRDCVGIMVLNRDGLVLVGRRNDVVAQAWQMPQGGIDTGEKPEDAALRELEEETGIRSVTIITESRSWKSYDYPPDVMKRSFANRYRGQRQMWYAMRFLGQDTEVNLHNGHAEFNAWKWTGIDTLAPGIVPFKRPVYEEVVAEFRHLAGPA